MTVYIQCGIILITVVVSRIYSCVALSELLWHQVIRHLPDCTSISKLWHSAGVLLQLAHREVVCVHVTTQRANLALHNFVRTLLILQHHLHQVKLALHQPLPAHS